MIIIIGNSNLICSLVQSSKNYLMKDRVTPRDVSVQVLPVTQVATLGGSAVSQSSQQNQAGSLASQPVAPSTPKVIKCRTVI